MIAAGSVPSLLACKGSLPNATTDTCITTTNTRKPNKPDLIDLTNFTSLCSPRLTAPRLSDLSLRPAVHDQVEILAENAKISFANTFENKFFTAFFTIWLVSFLAPRGFFEANGIHF